LRLERVLVGNVVVEVVASDVNDDIAGAAGIVRALTLGARWMGRRRREGHALLDIYASLYGASPPAQIIEDLVHVAVDEP